MESKKNPKADLTKKSALFLQIGLVLVLFATWQAIDWKTYDRSNIDIGQVNLDELEEEDIPITQNLNTPPPPPPPPQHQKLLMLWKMKKRSKRLL